MSQRALYILQRVTAALLVPFLVVHLLVIMYAMRGGITAQEILDRTQGSPAWGLFYGAFVVLAAVHGPIGVRNVVREWTRWRGRSLDAAMLGLALLFLFMGVRAVVAVVT